MLDIVIVAIVVILSFVFSIYIKDRIKAGFLSFLLIGMYIVFVFCVPLASIFGMKSPSTGEPLYPEMSASFGIYLLIVDIVVLIVIAGVYFVERYLVKLYNHATVNGQAFIMQKVKSHGTCEKLDSFCRSKGIGINIMASVILFILAFLANRMVYENYVLTQGGVRYLWLALSFFIWMLWLFLLFRIIRFIRKLF